MKLGRFLVILFILAALLEIYQLSFFEFKNDQVDAIRLGQNTLDARFRILHGTASGIGVNNHPLFLWFMGILVSLTKDPLLITAVFSLLNLAALLLALRYFKNTLEPYYAVCAALLIAFTPAMRIYANIIWAQSILPLVMIIFQITICKFIQSNEHRYFIFMVILSCIAAGLHMSGFFLFPLLLIVALTYRKQLGLRFIALGAAFAIILLLPYIYHLVWQKEGLKIIDYWNEVLVKKTIYWKVFREQVRIASFDFMRRYLAQDFMPVLRSELGVLSYILYPLSALLMPFYACGLLAYGGFLINSRRLFDTRGNLIADYPLPFQIAGFLTLGVTLGYLIFKIRTPTHYLLILYPSSAIISAYWVFRLKRLFFVRLLFILSVLATLVCFVASLNFIKRAGGHPDEYGPSYGFLSKIKHATQKFIPAGRYAAYEIKFLSSGKTDAPAVDYVLSYGNPVPKNTVPYPLKLTIDWNKQLMRYEYGIGK